MSPLSLPRRASRGALAALLFAVSAGSLVIGASAASASEPFPTIPLHNATAQTEDDCPAGGGAYWHFILAPNKGSAFESITLDLGDDTLVATGGDIIANGGQADNVFVAVPSGHELGDLELAGSFASYSGATPTHFNLSHVCEGSSQPSVTQPPVTEPPVTEPPVTEPPVTEPPVTEPPVTEPPGTDDTVTPATVLGVTVDSEPTPAAAVSTNGTLPYTGSEDLPFLVAGLACLGGGLLLASAARAKLARSDAER
jgi:LPXTG-motif cell wall-anchored protein